VFEAKRKRNLFGSPKTQFTVYGGSTYIWQKHKFAESSSQLLFASLWMMHSVESFTLHWTLTPLWTWTVVYDSGRTGSDPKVNALNQVRHSKKIKLNFLFLIVFYWWRSICRIWSQSQFCFWLYFTWCCCALKKSRKL
jgi:hypothetical protein